MARDTERRVSVCARNKSCWRLYWTEPDVPGDVADDERTEREARLPGELAGRLAPRLAVLAGDQEERPGVVLRRLLRRRRYECS